MRFKCRSTAAMRRARACCCTLTSAEHGMRLGPSRKKVLSLAGSAIGTAYVASNPLYVGGVARLRLYGHIETGASSPLTTVTVKVQQRYSDQLGGVPPLPRLQLGWVDTASQDAAGTSSVEHAFTVSAAGAFDFAVVLDPLAIPDLQVLEKGNAVGQAGDGVAVYVAAPL
jgi:hypothetical protein